MLQEWLEFSAGKYPLGKYFYYFLVLWGMISCFAIGYGPYLTALENCRKQFRKVDDDVYTFQPNIEFRQLQPLPGEKRGIKYSTDEDGSRYCPYSSGTKGVPVILVGDSFIFGLHLDTNDTLCSTLGDAFKKRGFAPFTVRNLGMAGLNFPSYMRVIDHQLKNREFDWIVIGYLSRNDFVPTDTFYEIQHLQESSAYQLFTIVFGADTLNKSLNWYDNRFETREPEYERFAPYIKFLQNLADKKM